MTVVDDRLGDLTAIFFASPTTVLAPGESLTRYLKMAWGTDTTNLRTFAKKEGDKYIVNGQKIWTSTAHWAEVTFQYFIPGTVILLR